jgi:hypothetical protein
VAEDVPEDVGAPDLAGPVVANPSGIVYGVLAVATVIAAEATRQETFRRLFIADVITMVLYWVAHAYSHHWGSRFQKAAEWSVRDLVTSLVFESSILLGAVVPTAVLLIAWIAGSSLESAVTSVLWAAAVEIVILEMVPSIRNHLGPKDLVLQTLAGVSLGVGLLALRLVLH